MSGLIKFLASANGRIVRIAAGVVIILLGLLAVWPSSAVGGLVVVIIGAIPLLAGAFDVCLFAPLAGLPFKGTDIRKQS